MPLSKNRKKLFTVAGIAYFALFIFSGVGGGELGRMLLLPLILVGIPTGTLLMWVK